MTAVPVILDAAAARARIAVASYFFVFGLCIGSWAPHIPLAKERLVASPGWFGAALLCMGLGAVLAMPLAGVLVGRWGSARVGLFTAALTALSLPLPAFAPDLKAFAAGLFILGAATGSLDVAMNAHGLIVERALKKPVMSSLHGMYSVAALAAAGLSALLIDAMPETSRMSLSAALCLAIVVGASRWLLPASIDKGRSNSPLALPTRATLGLGLLCLLALMVEGSVMEWAGIHLRENLKASAGVTSLLVAAFSGGMAISRMLGDQARLRLGSAMLVRVSALATAVFMLLAVTAGDAVVSLAAFAATGFALGPVAPVLFAGGGRAEPDDPGRGIAAVTTFGYTGGVVGPPLIGMLAEFTGLEIALGLMAVFALVIWAFAGVAKAADGRE